MKPQMELYIHIPFCMRKCNYCDFLSFRMLPETQEAYVKKLCEELTVTAAACRGYAVSSVFIGGGTPSVLEAEQIRRIMEAVHLHYEVLPEAEITIECNPGSTLRHKFAAYRKAGINRLSIGLQSADNAELKMLGRIHSFEEFLKCYQGARMEGFENVNVDLINCIPMQSLKTWRKTLRTVLMLKPEHVSVYNLIIEEGTPFYDMYQNGLLMMPDEDTQAEIDAFTVEYLEKQGYQRYEISNYAKPGYASRHNLGYWRGVPYIGFGLGAASFFEDFRWNNVREMETYLALDFQKDAGVFEKLRTGMKKLSREEEMEEFMFLGLRTVRGVSETEFLTRFGQHIDSVYGAQLSRFTANGLMEKNGYDYRLTPRGMDLSNQVMSEFLL